MNKTYIRAIQDGLASYCRVNGFYPRYLVVDKDRFYDEVKDWLSYDNNGKATQDFVCGIPTVDIDDTLIIPPPNDE